MSPKLNKKIAAEADEASGSFQPLTPGVYHVRLVNVDGSREGPAGPYWSWEFEVLANSDGDPVSGKLWNNTSLSKAARFKLKESFDAFGVSTDTDTDELVGEICRAVVTTRTIEAGSRKGEEANQVERLRPADPEFADSLKAKAGSDDPDF